MTCCPLGTRLKMRTSVPGGCGARGRCWRSASPGARAHAEASPHRLRGRGRRRVPQADEEAQEEGEKEPVSQPLQSDDPRVENMDISDEGKGPASPFRGVGGQRGSWGQGWKSRDRSPGPLEVI